MLVYRNNERLVRFSLSNASPGSPSKFVTINSSNFKRNQCHTSATTEALLELKYH